jgi:outer membrane protein TolC
MKRILILMLHLILLPVVVNAQDTIKTLNAEQVLMLIKQYHPVARQAAIEVEQARAEVLMARAAFDPVLSYGSARKTLGGENYYEYNSTQLTIPTWYGIELTGGADFLKGNRIDESATTGQTGYIGLNIPLAKNLIIDKRRAYLKQAKLFKEMSLADQRAMINDLLLDAMDAYWQWVNAYQNFVVVRDNVNITIQRNDLIRKSFVNGERPAIDTVEALTQLQSFQYQQNQSWLAFQNAGLMLSVYLWKSNNTPYTLPETVVPQTGWENETIISKFNLVLDDLLSVALNNHPELQQYDYKIDVLKVERQLKFQQLLPKVDFSYNQLGKGTEWYNTSLSGPLFGNNFQYGLKMEMPLRLSEGRAGYKQARLKVEFTQLERFQKMQMVNVKVKSYYNEMVTLRNQIELQSNNYNNYKLLVKAEEVRFANGESSLFLINSREAKALEALQKLIDLKTKYYKTIYALQWSAGLLSN